MAQVGNLKRFIRGVDRSSGGLVAPPPGGLHYFESILTVGPGDHHGSPWDTITAEGGSKWIQQAEDDGSVTLLRSGLYTFQNWGFDFRAGTTPLTENEEARVFLTYINANYGPQFCWWKHKITAAQVSAGRAFDGNDGPSHTLFLPKGAVVRLGASGIHESTTAAMELYVMPVAFAD